VTRIVVYTIAAGSASVSGVLLAGFSGGASVDIGRPYLFSTIAAVVVGGTALIGGRGGYGRTIAGVFITIEVQTLLIGLKVGASMQQVFLGLIILVLVTIYGRDRSVAQRI
jgi:ribose transport system permease protein